MSVPGAAGHTGIVEGRTETLNVDLHISRFDEAIGAYQKGLDVEPGLAMLTKGLEDAKREARKSEYAFKPGLNYYAFGSPAS